MKLLVIAVLTLTSSCIGPEHEDVRSVPRQPGANATEPVTDPEPAAAVEEVSVACLRCETAMSDSAAYRCSYRCTFCETCSIEMEHVCPNCGGDLASVADE